MPEAGLSMVNSLDCDGWAWPVRGLGPGRRVALWVRGCERRCADCMSPDLSFPGARTSIEDVALALQPGLDRFPRLTVSGGEPFDQPAAVAALIERVREDGPVEVLAYSGSTIEELERRDNASVLLDAIDLLIDGPFLPEQSDRLRWRGSDNQRVIALTARGARYGRLFARPKPLRPELHFQQLGGGRFRLVGIPRGGDLTRLNEAMRERGTPLATRTRTEVLWPSS